VDCSESTIGDENLHEGTLQVVEEATRPIVEGPTFSRAGKSARVSASKSGLLLKRNKGVLVLDEENFYMELEESEKLPLTEQKRKMKQSMMEVQLVYSQYIGCIISHWIHFLQGISYTPSHS